MSAELELATVDVSRSSSVDWTHRSIKHMYVHYIPFVSILSPTVPKRRSQTLLCFPLRRVYCQQGHILRYVAAH